MLSLRVGPSESLIIMCSVEKGCVYTQDVAAEDLLNVVIQPSGPTLSPSGLGVEVEWLNAKAGRTCKSTLYLTWLNNLYGRCSWEGSCADELLDVIELVQKMIGFPIMVECLPPSSRELPSCGFRRHVTISFCEKFWQCQWTPLGLYL